MKSTKVLYAAMALMCGAAFASTPALADHYHGYGYYNDYDYHHWHGYPQEEVVVVPGPVIVQQPPVIVAPAPVYTQRIIIAPHDRTILLGYIQHYHHHHCPPGTVHVYHGCAIPAQPAYVIGQPLPNGVVVSPVEPGVLAQLGPVPPDYYYVQTYNDVLLVNRHNHRVADVVTLAVR